MQQRDIKERELDGRITERSSKYGAGDGTELPIECVKWHDVGLVRWIGGFSEDSWTTAIFPVRGHATAE